MGEPVANIQRPVGQRVNWEMAVQIARRVTGDPCGGATEIIFDAALVVPTGAYAGTNGHWRPLCPGGIVMHPHLPRYAHTLAGWYWACSLLVHEMFHIAGYWSPDNAADPTHSNDSHHVMHPEGGGTHPACNAAWDAQGERARRLRLRYQNVLEWTDPSTSTAAIRRDSF